MKRLTSPFRSLRWKLTFSYTLVTVATLIAVEALVLGIGVAVYVFLLNRAPGVVVDRFMPHVSAQLMPRFVDGRPDLAAIDDWLQDVRQTGISIRGEDEAFELTAQDLARPEVRLLVFDAEGRLLAEDDQTVPFAAPKAFDPSQVPGLDEVLAPALRGETAPSRLYARTGFLGYNRLTMAAPILADAEVQGAVAVTGPFSPGIGIAKPVLVTLGISAFVFTLGAGGIGMIFGFFTARGFTRRLDRMVRAASAWREGDFPARIEDASGDELGQLSRDLDRMARDIEALLEARQRLAGVEERNRLARDLHDSVKQQVFAISMNLAAVRDRWDQDPATARRALDAAYELARQSQRELSNIIQALRPVELADKRLTDALRDLVERWRVETGIRGTCEVDDAGQSLSSAIEDALYRIAQEALANVARHSGASTVRVTLTVRPGGARMDVVDDGKGFETGKSPTGMGLATMRDRAAAVGGEIDVTSDVRGTAVRVSIPLTDGVVRR